MLVISKELPVASLSAETKAIVDLLKVDTMRKRKKREKREEERREEREEEREENRGLRKERKRRKLKGRERE